MKVENNLKNRCGIFLFYDRDGIVDDYILYMLKDLRQNLSYLLVVCNGEPGEEGLKRLQSESDEVLIRANHGFDVGGYREGLFYLGFKELQKYDEIVLFNYTFFGGIYPFSEMFEKMSTKDLDFWGITKHHKVEVDPYGKNRYGYMPEHIQSHFLVLRNSLVSSDDYKEFIISMKNPESYVDSICDYETILTKHFEDLGYKWEVYADTARYERYAYCPVMFYIKDMLEKDRCPIIKRRSFFTDYKDFLINTCGQPSVEAYDYIRNHTDYDVNMIWDNILRVENISEVHKVMQFNYCMPEQVSYDGETLENMQAAIWVKQTESLVFYQEFLENRNCDIVLYGSAENTKKVAYAAGAAHLNIAPEEPGTYQEFLAAVQKNHKPGIQYYALLVMDTVEKIRPYSNEISNVFKDWKCIFASDEYMINQKHTFLENPRMGLGIPPVPDFGEFFAKYADGWAGNYEKVSEYLERIAVRVNKKKEIAPLIPTEGAVMIKADCLCSDSMTEALKEPVEDDVFYIALPFIVQGMRYYTGTLYSNEYAAVDITNSDYMMRELNKAVFDKYGTNYHSVVADRVKNNILEQPPQPPVVDNNWKARTKRRLKKVLPEKIYLKGKKYYFHLRGREFKG